MLVLETIQECTGDRLLVKDRMCSLFPLILAQKMECVPLSVTSSPKTECVLRFVSTSPSELNNSMSELFSLEMCHIPLNTTGLRLKFSCPHV